MPSISDVNRARLKPFSDLIYCNPFSTQRIDAEKAVLGQRFVADQGIAWSRSRSGQDQERTRPNIELITREATELVRDLRDCLREESDPVTLGQYWDVVTYVLLYQHIVQNTRDELLEPVRVSQVWKRYRKDYDWYTDIPGLAAIGIQDAPHLFACLCQVHRAFIHIFDNILGDSPVSVQLRRSVWESVFTNDLRRYRRSLYDRMGQLPTLITGPSGTGKELVARAIGLSQYIPFDPQRQRFLDDGKHRFQALNLAALSETLIESELFGHLKGAYTGAIDNRMGWLEQCPAFGSIFLDEIGELNLTLQVKLLRVVQHRSFSRIGESKERQFTGKLVAATNRDLSREMQEGRFREDFYYRLCSDRIQTPTLRQQLDDRPADLESLVCFIASRLCGSDALAVAEESLDWIRKNLGPDYGWPGNIRELEQCVSSIMIRGEYTPSISANPQSMTQDDSWFHRIRLGELSCDQMLQQYCTWVYFRTGSYEAAGRQLGLDRRTVKSRVDVELLNQLKSQ